MWQFFAGAGVFAIGVMFGLACAQMGKDNKDKDSVKNITVGHGGGAGGGGWTSRGGGAGGSI